MKTIRSARVISLFLVALFIGSGLFANASIVSAFSRSTTAASTSTGSASNALNPNTPSVSVPTQLHDFQNATFLGKINPNQNLSLQITLPDRNPTGLQDYLSGLYNPLSPFYHQFLTQAQFDALYGPDTAEANLLQAYLESKGMSFYIDPMNPDIAEVEAQAAQIESAFNTTINQYQQNGSIYYSANSAAQLPSTFSNIQMIYGLENYDSQGKTGAIPMVITLGPVTPGQGSGANVYYSPSEIEQMYNETGLLNDGYNGTGVQIAIVDAYGDPNIQQEVDNFSSFFGIPTTTVNVIGVDCPAGGCNYAEGITEGWSTEIQLDVEWAHALAPGAEINLYIGSNNGPALYDAVEAAVEGYDNTTADVFHNNIISMSWGGPENNFISSQSYSAQYEGNYPWLDQVFQQAAALGITAFASAGDWGAYEQGLNQQASYGGAIYPCTDPFVTCVGGTSLYMATTGGNYSRLSTGGPSAVGTYGTETAWSWNDYYEWGTGGGYSSLFTAPSYQSGPGFSSGSRGVPDVAWDADPTTGVLVVSDQSTTGFYAVGGTSVGSPSWAGALATIEQKAGAPLGLINPSIYSILNNPQSYAKAFHDVTVGNNDPYSAGTGWDPLTGVGTPNLGELADILAPTGSLSVAVTNDLSNSPQQSYAYNQVINLSATVNKGGAPDPSATVVATLTGPSGATISTVSLTFNTTSSSYEGSYAIQSGDPAGQWFVTVVATDGSYTGTGYTSFAVGDGATINEPLPYADGGSYSFMIGSLIPISATVNTPNDTAFVTSGSVTATFYLNSPSGTEEASTSLQYEDGFWIGNVTVPQGADQGQWVMVITGQDSSGNSIAPAYSYMTVGLTPYVYTDEADYVLGDTIYITVPVVDSSGNLVTTGSFTATITDGSTVVGTVPLSIPSGTYCEQAEESLSGAVGYWIGSFTPSSTDPTGYYTITVSGSDGAGNYGSGSTVVQMGSYHLNVQVTLSSSSISPGQNLTGATAVVTTPSGTPVTVGRVEGYLLWDLGNGITTTPIGQPATTFVFTYNAALQEWVTGSDIFQYINATQAMLGKYDFVVYANDPLGDYGNASASFTVKGTYIQSIDITSDADFTTANGVINPTATGNTYDPFIIAGVNTTSISIGGLVADSFELYNDYVSGSTSDGISLTGSSTFPLLEYVQSVGNTGDGIYVANMEYFSAYNVVTSNNGGDGLKLVGTTIDNGLFSVTAIGNGQNGIEIIDSPDPLIFNSIADSNAQAGISIAQVGTIESEGMVNGSELEGNAVGLNITGPMGYEGFFVTDNVFESNGIGVSVNDVASPDLNYYPGLIFGISYFAPEPEPNLFFQNGVGISATNQTVFEDAFDSFLENGVGISTQDSSPALYEVEVGCSAGNGIQITGYATNYSPMWPDMEDYNLFNGVLIYTTAFGNGGSGIVVTNDTNFYLYGVAGVLNTGDGVLLNNLNGVMLDSTGCPSDSDCYDYYMIQNGANGLEINNITGLEVNPYDHYAVYIEASNNTGDGIKITNMTYSTLLYDSYIYADNNTANGVSMSNLYDVYVESYIYGSGIETSYNGANGFELTNITSPNDSWYLAFMSNNNGNNGIKITNATDWTLYQWGITADNNTGDGMLVNGFFGSDLISDWWTETSYNGGNGFEINNASYSDFEDFGLISNFNGAGTGVGSSGDGALFSNLYYFTVDAHIEASNNTRNGFELNNATYLEFYTWGNGVWDMQADNNTANGVSISNVSNSYIESDDYYPIDVSYNGANGFELNNATSFELDTYGVQAYNNTADGVLLSNLSDSSVYDYYTVQTFGNGLNGYELNNVTGTSWYTNVFSTYNGNDGVKFVNSSGNSVYPTEFGSDTYIFDVENNPNTGLELVNSSDNYFYYYNDYNNWNCCSAIAFTQGSTYGILINGGSGNQFYDYIYANSNTYGIVINASSDNYFDGVETDSGTYGILINGGSGNYFDSGTYTDGNTYNIVINASSDNTLDDVCANCYSDYGTTLYGILVNGSSSNDLYWVDSYDANIAGVQLINSNQTYIEVDEISNNYVGISINGTSSFNTIDGDYDWIENNHVGVLFGPGSNNNYMSDYTYVGDNYIGVEFDNSWANTVQFNYLYGNTYAYYFVNGADNVWNENFLDQNSNIMYPATTPTVAITSPTAGTNQSGTVTISWTATGDSLSPGATVTIDGVSHETTGSSYSWNTANVPDGTHTITVTVENTGGFSASSSVVVYTKNQATSLQNQVNSLQNEINSLESEITQIQAGLSNHALLVQTVAPGGIALVGETVYVSNSTFSTSGTTGSTGFIQFLGLAAGTYTVKSTINATLLTTPVDLITNATVILEPPVLTTTFTATGPNGQSILFSISGNITASQISGAELQKLSNGTYVLSFTVSGENGTVGTATITVPKSEVPTGMTPTVYIDGTQAASQSYTQDANNYYVTFSTHFSTHQVQIRFTPTTTSTTTTSTIPPPSSAFPWLEVIVVALVVIVAAGGLIFVTRRRKNSAPTN